MIFQLKGIVNVPPYRQQFTIESGRWPSSWEPPVPAVFNAASIQIFMYVQDRELASHASRTTAPTHAI